MDIKGTVALVTGGASGLGAATARRLFDAGASVVLVDLPQSAGEEFAAELNATSAGQQAVFSAADVTDEAQIQAAIDAAAAWANSESWSIAPESQRPARSLAATACYPLKLSTKSFRSTS